MSTPELPLAAARAALTCDRFWYHLNNLLEDISGRRVAMMYDRGDHGYVEFEDGLVIKKSLRAIYIFQGVLLREWRQNVTNRGWRDDQPAPSVRDWYLAIDLLVSS